MFQKTLKNDIVLIRPIAEEDTHLILRWRNNEDVKRHFIFQDDLTEEMHNNWFNSYIVTGKVAQFIIEDVKSSKPIGSVYLRDIDKVNNKAEFGIFLGTSEVTGLGYGTAANKLILEYAFKILKLNKVFLRVFEENERAIKSYKKAGFNIEGCFNSDVKINNIYRNVVFMAIFSSEEE